MPTKYKLLASLLLPAVIFAFKTSAQIVGPVVKTDKGYVRGIIENGIVVFKGVPYSAPPVGQLRFKAPVAHPRWGDTLSAQQFGNIATQVRGKGATGSEDCLSLNIYTPRADGGKRAVVVWVHGGSMTAGSGKGMDGHAFADNDDVITVTINYRLGVFGFLYLGDVDKSYASSGNNGTLDVIMALTWIRHNIAAFGGDPNRVTIMGESAGAKLISAVMVSPASKGLFSQYIAESGSVQCIRDTVTAKNERLRILQQLGLGPNDVAKLLTMPADSLMKAQAIACAGIGGNSFFGPVNDGVVINADPYQYADGRNLKGIKALIGTNKSEAAAFINKAETLRQIDSGAFKAQFQDNYPMAHRSYESELQHTPFYEAAVKVLTQYMYQMHSYRWAKALSQNGAPVWVYRFDYANGPLGAAHATELQYVWHDAKISDPEKKQLADKMHSAWVAFIKTGYPNTPLLPQWPKYNDTGRQVMVFDTDTQVTPLTEVFNDKNFPSAVFVMK